MLRWELFSMVNRMKRVKPSLISLYSGAGGMDYGFEAAGYETRVAVELDHHCCETLRGNRSWPVIERSIFDVPSVEILEKANLRKGEADLLIGGPPCQPFSKSGYWAKGDSLRLKDKRADTLSAYLRVLEDAQPRAFVLENVEGLAFSGKDEGLKLILSRLAAINARTGLRYKATFRAMSAADYGVPQLRTRFIIVGSRDGNEFNFPAATHGDPASPAVQAGKLKAFHTAWDVLADVRPGENEDLSLRGKWAKLLPAIPEGKNYLYHTAAGGGLPLFGWRTRYWNFLLKLAKNRPSWTIQAQPGPSVGPFHWENRRLSARELCRIQTFPDDVNITGPRIAVQRQVGNAVPSLLAEVLGRAISVQLLDRKLTDAAPTLMPQRRTNVPSPHRVARVPVPFRSLQGQHDAHPGTGKGRGAVERRVQLETA